MSKEANRKTRAEPTRAETRSADGERLAHAVEDELYHDPVVSFDNVDVTSSGEGAVVLTGTVASLLTKERAERVAETVRGVEEVENRLVVRPRPAMSPEDLESTIVQALLTNPATESFDVQVQAGVDGEVRLSGKVNSWAEQTLAERVAKGVSGVTAVRSDIEVNYPPLRPDTEIAADVDTMLRWDAYLDDRGIDVEVTGGVVTLSGKVASAAEKRRAQDIAWTAGTERVDADALVVDPSLLESDRKKALTNVSDTQIAQAVRTLLRTQPTVAPNEIEASVESGVVTLRGSVESLRAKRAAKDIAQAVTGVHYVRNRIRVRDDTDPLTDAEIEKRVIAALAANPITEVYMITVDVRDGVADLSGIVDTWFERGTADDVAATVRGVREVDNNLEVENRSASLVFDPYVDTWSVYDFDWYDPQTTTRWRDDSAIAQEIRNELWWSPFVDEQEVTVSVTDGVATLTGAVDSWSERRAATENALEGGAVGVVNRLEVEI